MSDTMPYFVKLRNRGLIKISGTDTHDFLQGLISNDMRLLEKQDAIYACLLTPQGKFLHDFFVVKQGDGVVLDCEGGARAEDLARRLSMYKLRADVVIAVTAEADVYAVFGSDAYGYKDPRHEEMGYRSFEKPADMEERDFAEWDRQRILLTIPDGSRDMEVERSTLLECGIDRVNGVSFDKGCFMGQELTARMHYRNLGKKHLRTVQAVEGAILPDYDAPILSADGKVAGTMYSSCGDVGIAMVRDDVITSLTSGMCVIT